MPTHVALLRGVNVGGKKLAMADLRKLVESLGYDDVVTYIQSGNVLFTPPRRAAQAIAAELEDALVSRLGLSSRVVVLSRSDLQRLVRDNPYRAEQNPKCVHAVFLTEAPGRTWLTELDDLVELCAAKGTRDRAQVVGRTLFLHTPDGFGRSELAARVMRSLNGSDGGPAGTARNWATVTKLLTLCD